MNSLLAQKLIQMKQASPVPLVTDGSRCEPIKDESPSVELESNLPEVQPSLPGWHVPSVVETQADDYPNKLAKQLDQILGCAVWLVQRSRRGRITKRCLSQTAADLLVTSEELESIAADVVFSKAPIASGVESELPLGPSAIMDQVWASRPGTSSMSMNLPSLCGADPWVITLAWRDQADHTTALRIAAWLDLNAPQLGEVLEAWSLQQMGRRRQKRLTAFRTFLNKPLRWIALGVVAFAGLLCIPYPYRPVRKCTVEPSSRRYIASPIEGRLKTILVRPATKSKPDNCWPNSMTIK